MAGGEEDMPEMEMPNYAYFSRGDYEDGMNEGEMDTSMGSSSSFSSAQIEPPVRHFLINFHAAVSEQNIVEIHSGYDSSWSKLSEKFFNTSPWPSAEAVAPLVGNDHAFLILYKELSYRHIYAKLQPSLEERFSSFDNYCDLFNYILNAEEQVQLELPNQWLWDIIDEFIYQFQSFCQYRSKLKSKTSEEINALKENPHIWNVHSVLNVLHSLIEKSRIQEQLLAAKKGENVEEAAGEFGSRPLYKMLGYFSIIGLLRLHCLLGDYYLALDVMSNIDLKQKSTFNRVTSCYITTFYYVGFCYLMMRRYQDAIRTFSHILTFISRTMQLHTRSFQYNIITKQNEQMFCLLAIALSLYPQRIEESVSSALREKQGEKIDQVQQGENFEEVFSNWFSFSCPKFVSPFPPDYDSENLANTNQEPLKLQLRIFLREVRQQMVIPVLRSYLKLYTSMDVGKLAAFMNISEDEVRTALLCAKHKTRQKRWESGSAFEGEFGSMSDINFYLKENMVHVTETRHAKRFGDYFIRHINKFEDLLENWNQPSQGSQ